VNHPITWGEVVTVIILIWLGLFLLRFLLSIVVALIIHRQDMKTEEEVETHEPYAGKTLGL
jgi:hypothetical protein